MNQKSMLPDTSRAANDTQTAFVPVQHRSSKKQMVGTNHYEQWMPKHRQACCVFHSYAELYYAALLEADIHVSRYVPQPCVIPLQQVRGGHRRKSYTPDFYVLFGDGQEVVVELASETTYATKPVEEATEYLARYGVSYRVLKNSEVYQHLQLAHNWLYIARVLVTHWSPNFKAAYQAALKQLRNEKSLPLADLETFLAPLPSLCARSVVFKLLHNGEACARLDQSEMTAETEVTYHA